MLTIGCHLSKRRGYLEMAKEAASINANTFQYFTRSPRGSHVDRHARIGEGKIGFDALAALVNHPKLAGVPFYLEEPDSTLVIYERDVARFQEAYKG